MKTGTDFHGHLAAIFSVVIWGMTFIFSKIMLTVFTPLEILIYRFGLGILALAVIYPHRLKGTTRKQELMFAGAGLCGVTLYFLMENIALTYTLTSNVAVIVSISPFFTALFSHLFLEDEKLKKNFFLGFAIAMAGIVLINFNGSIILKLSPLGDLMALVAAAAWGAYCVLTKKISKFGYHTIQTTRRIFLYGFLFMIPSAAFLPFQWGLERFLQPTYLFNLLFLSLGASALCFVTWNTAVKRLGTIKTSIYIYIIPAITVVTSLLILQEQVTLLSLCGTLLALLGLFLSERKAKAPQ